MTTIWDEDWFISLSKDEKLFWQYIKDKCDHAGIWKPNVRVFNSVNEAQVELEAFFEKINSDKERIIKVNASHWLLVDFFKVQYGTILNTNNRVHKSIFDRYAQLGVNLTSIRGLKGVKEGVKEREKDKDSINTINKEQQEYAENHPAYAKAIENPELRSIMPLQWVSCIQSFPNVDPLEVVKVAEIKALNFSGGVDHPAALLRKQFQILAEPKRKSYADQRDYSDIAKG